MSLVLKYWPVNSEDFSLSASEFLKRFYFTTYFCLQGEFEWMFRSRIRITLHGENLCATPFELHEHVIHPSYRLVFMKLSL